LVALNTSLDSNSFLFSAFFPVDNFSFKDEIDGILVVTLTFLPTTLIGGGLLIGSEADFSNSVSDESGLVVGSSLDSTFFFQHYYFQPKLQQHLHVQA